MAKAQKSQELEAQKENAISTFDISSDLESYVAEHDVRDIENDEIITPRISLLQSMSKQVKKSEAEYIKGAEEGSLFNTLTKEVYSGETGITFVPCYSERVYNEWIPVDAGGGLAKRWGDDDSFKRSGEYIEEKGKYQKLGEPDKKSGQRPILSEIVKTADYYVLVLDKEKGTFYPAVLGFSGTKYKIHRKLINDISVPDYAKADGTCITPPPFFRVYNLVTVPESDGTNSWFNYKFSRDGNIESLPNKDAVWKSAKEFRALVQEGKIVAAAEQEVTPAHDEPTTI